MASSSEITIWAYADLIELRGCRLLGWLHAQHNRGKEVFLFKYKTGTDMGGPGFVPEYKSW